MSSSCPHQRAVSPQRGLDATDRAAVEQHLAQCEHCAGYVQQVQRMLELTAAGGAEADPIPAPLLNDLMEQFRRRC